MITRRNVACLLAAAVSVRAARAASLPAPGGRVILTVSGRIDAFNEAATARFDRGMLEALGISTFTTATPWYDHPVTFEGVRMAKVMEAVRGTGDTIICTALNDYETRIPISDFTTFDVLLAMKRDGEYMPVRDKGPLFIVYPFDSDPVLRNQRYYGRSAWQLSRIAVV
jgi:hypothetical protein